MLRQLLDFSFYLSFFIPVLAQIKAWFHRHDTSEMSEVIVQAITGVEIEIQTENASETLQSIEAEKLLVENVYFKSMLEHVNKENAELKKRVEAEQMYNEHSCALDTLMEQEKVAEELNEKDRVIQQLKEELNKEKKKRKMLHKGITVTKVRTSPRKPFQQLNEIL